jgi:hypothetical protein
MVASRRRSTRGKGASEANASERAESPSEAPAPMDQDQEPNQVEDTNNNAGSSEVVNGTTSTANEDAHDANAYGTSANSNETPTSKENEKDSCPACKDKPSTLSADSAVEADTWIRCDNCKKWFHWKCVKIPDRDHESVDRW